MLLTCARVSHMAAVESWQAAFTAPPTGVVQASQTLAASTVAASRHTDVNVPVTVAGRAASVPSWVTIETLLTHVTAST